MPFSFGDEPANPGDSTAVNCMVTKGDLPLTFKWILNAHEVVSGQGGVTIVKMTPRLSALSIESISDRHRGTLRCIAENGAGVAVAESELFVNVPPQIIPFTFGTEPSNLGEIAGIQCLVPKGDLPLEIHWTLNSAPIVTGEEEISVTRMSPRSSSLSIDNLSWRHRGTYKCIATNLAGSAEVTSELKINVPPQIIPFTFGDEASNPGDSHAVHCTVTKGDVPIDIRWSLNGQPLVNSENGVTIFRMSPRLSSLSIDNVKDIHRGVFKCTASNAAGTTDYATELIVNVPPQILPFAFGDEPSNLGESIGVQCMVTKGDLPVEIRWMHNSEAIMSGRDSFTVSRLNPRTSYLNIESLSGIHRGVYSCEARNVAGLVENSAQLRV
uniref:Ig-like domain-containing protein n=1 Tax=Phlebotomus papatasi TaxID=29031 RepID=A0A1B0DA17_PHLPP